jgi:hypothetical protein
MHEINNERWVNYYEMRNVKGMLQKYCDTFRDMVCEAEGWMQLAHDRCETIGSVLIVVTHVLLRRTTRGWKEEPTRDRRHIVEGANRIPENTHL